MTITGKPDRAFGQIRHTGNVTNTAFDAGFESLRAFNDAFKSLVGYGGALGRKQYLLDLEQKHR